MRSSVGCGFPSGAVVTGMIGSFVFGQVGVGEGVGLVIEIFKPFYQVFALLLVVDAVAHFPVAAQRGQGEVGGTDESL